MIKQLLKSFFVIVLLMISSLLSGQIEDSILYSFFVAGHTYGSAGVNNEGLHPPFVEKFEYIQNREEIELGILTGDIVNEGTLQNWQEVDADIETLGLPVFFAVGNHDMTNRPLFESLYGETYYYFTYRDDLFIILDPNIDGWNISVEQLTFLENTLSEIIDIENIYVFFHQLLWWEPDNIYSNIHPNSFEGRADTINFWTEVEPLFNGLSNRVFMFCGDLGAASWSSVISYDQYDNITLVGSGMGYINGENFVVVNVHMDHSVSYDLICLSDVEDCLGELTDYQISTDIPEDTVESKLFTIYPNPATDYIIIESFSATIVEFILYNTSGKIVQYSEFKTPNQSNYIRLDEISEGVFIGLVSMDGATHYFKLIKK